MCKPDSGHFHGASGSTQYEKEILFAELDANGVKYTKENVLFIARDATGQIVWLETGNKLAGLEHIIARHAGDFKRAFDLSEEQIAAYLENVVRYGKVVSNKIVTRNGRKGFEREYDYQGKHYVITGIGLNGFMVSAYPKSK